MSDHAQDHSHGESHYIKIWGILLVLLVVSVVGPMAEIWWLTLITAFGIAFVKASLVVKHFMHVTVERKIVHWILAGSLVLMVLLWAGVAPDVQNHEGTNWSNDAAKAAVERGIDDGDHGEDSDDEHGEGQD